MSKDFISGFFNFNTFVFLINNQLQKNQPKKRKYIYEIKKTLVNTDFLLFTTSYQKTNLKNEFEAENP